MVAMAAVKSTGSFGVAETAACSPSVGAATLREPSDHWRGIQVMKDKSRTQQQENAQSTTVTAPSVLQPTVLGTPSEHHASSMGSEQGPRLSG